MKVVHQLLNYSNLKIVQDTNMFNFSLDSVLLANFVTINKNINSVLDIGCGNAPIPSIISTRTKAKITGVEIQKDVYELAVETIKLNNLEKQVTIINDDINMLYKKWESDQYDVITCNPPFFTLDSSFQLSDSDYKKIARHELTLNLSNLMKISKKALKNNGVLAIIHRPDRLVEIISEMIKNNIEPKRIKFIHPYLGKDANMVLIEGKKNGGKGLKILPPLYAHNENKEYTEEIKELFK